MAHSNFFVVGEHTFLIAFSSDSTRLFDETIYQNDDSDDVVAVAVVAVCVCVCQVLSRACKRRLLCNASHDPSLSTFLFLFCRKSRSYVGNALNNPRNILSQISSFFRWRSRRSLVLVVSVLTMIKENTIRSNNSKCSLSASRRPH